MSKKSTSRSSARTEALCSVRGCSRKRKYVETGWCQTHYHRVYRTGSLEKVKSKPTEDLSYRGAHARTVAMWGPANEHICIECGKEADEWAYDGTDPSERHEDIRGKYPVRYSVWSEFYAPLCFGCHRLKDRSAWSARREYCPKGHALTEDNIYTRPSRPGTKECRQCRAESSRDRYLKKKERRAVPNED